MIDKKQFLENHFYHEANMFLSIDMIYEKKVPVSSVKNFSGDSEIVGSVFKECSLLHVRFCNKQYFYVVWFNFIGIEFLRRFFILFNILFWVFFVFDTHTLTTSLFFLHLLISNLRPLLLNLCLLVRLLRGMALQAVA